MGEKKIEKNQLSNGVTVLVDRVPEFQSVSFAINIIGGTRDESLETIGLTHLVEHMLFKRTKTKSTYDIACITDELGGDINAITDTDSMALLGDVPAARLT